MPELPEVTKLARELNVLLKGVEIRGLEIPPYKGLLKKVGALGAFSSENAEEQFRWLAGLNLSIEKVENYSKYLAFFLGEKVILSHFKFSGWWYLGWEGQTHQEKLHPVDTENLAKYSRLAFQTDKGVLYYTDPRALGSIWILDKKDFESGGPQRNLGPQVNSEEFTERLFTNRCRQNKKQAICDVLLDQRAFSGIGNYLRCEILYHARQYPFQTAVSIPDQQVNRIYRSIWNVVDTAFTNDNYAWWRVFQRKEAPDGSPVVRRPWKGRGVYFNPAQQVIYP